MLEFSPGEAKTAIVPMSNPTVRALDYTAILYLGVTVDAMATQAFHLEPGETKNVSFSIIMPTTLGTYPVYLDVSSEGVLVGHYQAEDILISLVPWVFYDVQCPIESTLTDWWSVDFSATIKNEGNRIATKVVRLYWKRVGIPDGWFLAKTEEVTLAPGETYQFASVPLSILIYYGITLELYAVDSDGYESVHCFPSM